MFSMRQNPLAFLLFGAIALALIALTLVFTGVLPPFAKQKFDPSDFYPAKFDYRVLGYQDLPGWRQDDQAQAFEAFLLSCEKIMAQPPNALANPVEAYGDHLASDFSMAGRVRDWRPSCEEARDLKGQRFSDDNAFTSAVRALFEHHFRPVQIINRRQPLPDGAARGLYPAADPDGKFTAYFEPVYPASAFKTTEFSVPLLARPDDLVMVDLGAFRDDLAGVRIAGSVKDGRLRPYPDHAEINEGALGQRARKMAWLRPNDLFFLQIQGSGRLTFRGGRQLLVGYDGQNGQPYTAIGRTLVERGDLALSEVSMSSILDWLAAAPAEEARRLREQNRSYVFFRERSENLATTLGPVGAGSVQLTPMRSLAVDRRFHAMGAPVWVSIKADQDTDTKQWRQLFIAQDTGGAIKGPVRGDIFSGLGPSAGDFAGALNVQGEMFVLVPTAAASRLK